MRKLFLSTIALLTITFTASASASSAAPDSVGVKVVNGIKMIVHKVDPKEGWISISRRYNVPLDQLTIANPEITELKIGQIIYVPIVPRTGGSAVPTNETTPAQTKPESALPKAKSPVTHTVMAGETMYSLSKKYNSSIEDIKSWNNLTGENLSLGQSLIVNYVHTYGNQPAATPEPVKSVKEETPATPAAPVPTKEEGEKKTKKELKKEAKDNEKEVKSSAAPAEVANPAPKMATLPANANENAQAHAAAKPGKPIDEKGIASWIDDNDINPTKYFALHRTAPAGTIVKVTNRMNNKYVYVKVVGVLPDTGDNNNLIIKISKVAAGKLEVLDARFQAELNYAVAE